MSPEKGVRSPLRKTALAWLVPDDPASVEAFHRHAAPALTHVSPTWLSLDAEAALHVTSGPEADRVMVVAREHGVAVVPLVVNERFRPEVAGAILEDPARRRRAVDALASFAERPGIAGINLDLEGPFGRWRSHYSEFVQLLAERLHGAGKTVSVDVVCQTQPPHDWQEVSQPSAQQTAAWVASWAEPYDYPALGAAVDQFILMGYDFHSRLSEPGPVGPIWWLREVLAYTLQVVPREKVLLGLPFYGRRWDSVEPMDAAAWRPREPATYARPRAASEAGFEPAIGLSWEGAVREKAEAVRTGLFPEEGSPWAVVPREGGRISVVHYDDAASLAGKLQLVREYALGGCAFWRLGQEDPQVWPHVRALG